MDATMQTYIIQVTNVAPAATLEQMRELFGFLGKIKNIKVFPETYLMDPHSKVCYVEYEEAASVGVAQHLTNTVFIDRALVVVPVAENSIPDENKAMALIDSNVQGISSGLCPVINEISGVDGSLVITTIDPRLTALGLPQYPPLPANMDPSKIEEIRRTVYIGNLSPIVTAEKLLSFVNQMGEVKYVRMAGDETQPTRFAFVEFSDQMSVANALQYNGALFEGRPLKINHSNNAIVKPQPKSLETAQKEIDEAMKRVKEAQSLITAAIEPELDKKKKKSHRSRSRSSSRHRSSSRSRRRKRSRSRSKGSRSRKRSRSRRRSSHHRSRSSSKRSKRKSRSRSKDRRKSSSPHRRKGRGRTRSRDRKKHRSKSRSRSRSKSKGHSSKSSKSKDSKSDKKSSKDKSPSKDRSSRKSMTIDDLPKNSTQSSLSIEANTEERGPPVLTPEVYLENSHDSKNSSADNGDKVQNNEEGKPKEIKESTNADDETSKDADILFNEAIGILATDDDLKNTKDNPSAAGGGESIGVANDDTLPKSKSSTPARSMSASGSPSKSPSKSKLSSKRKTRSDSNSRSRSPSERRSGSRSKKRSRSRKRSTSRKRSSHSKKRSRSRSKKPSRSHSKKRSRSRSKRSHSRSKRSLSRSKRRSRSRSRRSRSDSRRRSRTPWIPKHRKSRSPVSKRKPSRSPRRYRSRSGTRSSRISPSPRRSKRRSVTPKRYSRSPKHHSITPRRRSRKYSPSPRRVSRSPSFRKDSRTPRRSRTPKRSKHGSRRSSPRRSTTPKRRSRSRSSKRESKTKHEKKKSSREDRVSEVDRSNKDRSDSEGNSSGKDAAKVFRNYDEEEKGYDSSSHEPESSSQKKTIKPVDSPSDRNGKTSPHSNADEMELASD